MDCQLSASREVKRNTRASRDGIMPVDECIASDGDDRNVAAAFPLIRLSIKAILIANI